MEKLFLIRPDFQDQARNDGKKYFCPPCTLIKGVLSSYPVLLEKLEVIYVDYARPRPAIIELIGEANQSCPVLVLEDNTFIDDPDKIIVYLAEKYGIGYAH